MAGGQLREAPWLPPPGLPIPEHPQVSTLPPPPAPAPSGPGDLSWAWPPVSPSSSRQAFVSSPPCRAGTCVLRGETEAQGGCVPCRKSQCGGWGFKEQGLGGGTGPRLAPRGLPSPASALDSVPPLSSGHWGKSGSRSAPSTACTRALSPPAPSRIPCPAHIPRHPARAHALSRCGCRGPCAHGHGCVRAPAGARPSGSGSAATGRRSGSTGSCGACTTAACATAASRPRASATWSSPARRRLPSRAPSLRNPARCPRWAPLGGREWPVTQPRADGSAPSLPPSFPSRSWIPWPEDGRSATRMRWTGPMPHTHR